MVHYIFINRNSYACLTRVGFLMMPICISHFNIKFPSERCKGVVKCVLLLLLLCNAKTGAAIFAEEV